MFSGYFGQEHLVSKNKPIYNIVVNNKLQSLVLYGPPGIGKTKLANIIVKNLKMLSHSLNGAECSLNDLKDVINQSTIYSSIVLIIDEIHRLDSVKQNYLLKYIENNYIYIIGTTTENPYSCLSSAMRSRILSFELKPLSKINILNMLNSISDYGNDITEKIYMCSSGDVRMSINIVNFLKNNYSSNDNLLEILNDNFQNNTTFSNNYNDYHNLISALQKSIRASDLDAALHYCARLIQNGDYNSIIRRLIIMTYEDISIAAPNICQQVSECLSNFKNVGMPEGRIILAHAITLMALAPKSPSTYQALDSATNDLKDNQIDPVASHIMKYQPLNYEYDRQIAEQIDNLPKNLRGKKYLKNFNSSKSENLLFENYEMRNKLKLRSNYERFYPKQK